MDGEIIRHAILNDAPKEAPMEQEAKEPGMREVRRAVLDLMVGSGFSGMEQALHEDQVETLKSFVVGGKPGDERNPCGFVTQR